MDGEEPLGQRPGNKGTDGDDDFEFSAKKDKVCFFSQAQIVLLFVYAVTTGRKSAL